MGASILLMWRNIGPIRHIDHKGWRRVLKPRYLLLGESECCFVGIHVRLDRHYPYIEHLPTQSDR